ncbi:DUF2059 domain-containing protein [Rubrivirga sp.]|uniref:DUF2059 domain-containing protein n=1 Tax=Rubrivirga sp. TaxID=1885344 RepID=UPI003B51DFC3
MARLLLTFVLVALASAASAQDVSASHRAAAEELLELAGVETALASSLDLMIGAQIQQNPDLLPFEDVMRDFLAEHLSFESLREDIVAIYVETFTEPELRDLSAFYRTETGQKSVRLMPQVMARSMALGQQAVVEHQDELERRVLRRAAELAKRK